MTPEEHRRTVRGVVEEPKSANERFKEGFSAVVAGGLIAATLAHLALFELFPEMRAADVGSVSRATRAIELPPQVEVPPPPEAVARPATPKVSAAADISEDVTISKTSFEANPSERLPPPPKATARSSAEKRPEFIPYDVAPELKNPREVQQYLMETYPPELRANAVGGRVVLWLYIDRRGQVQETRVQVSSGYDALDRAAHRVGRRMEFTPAMNRDKRTPVWVQQGIEFEVK